MPIIDGLELPIMRQPILGPGVDALENRKEKGALVEMTDAQLQRNFESIREPLMRGLKALIKAPLNTT